MNLDQWSKTAEILESIAVIATLVLVVVEINHNTDAIERQSRLHRNASIYEPFLDATYLTSAYEKIKNVDGQRPSIIAFMDHYDLTAAEAISWATFLGNIWRDLETDFYYQGPTKHLKTSIEQLVVFPDNVLYLQHEGFSEAFTEYVKEIYRNGHDTPP